MHFVSQRSQTVASQPQDACSINLSDKEADAAPPRGAHQPVSKVAASADEGTSAGVLSHSTADTAKDDPAQGHKPVASAAAMSSITEPEAAATAAALPAFRLPDAVIAEPAELPQPQWAGSSARPAAAPVNFLSLAGRLPADLRAEAAHVASEEPSAITELGNAAAAFVLPEAAVAEPAQVPQLQCPAVPAHPAAVLVPAVSPLPAGSLPAELQIKAAHTAPDQRSAVKQSEAAAAAAATNALMLPEAVLDEPVQLPQLQWPDLSAHPAAVLAPAASPESVGRLPPELQAETALTGPRTSRSSAPAGSTSHQLSPVVVAVADKVCSPEQHSWLGQADEAAPDGRLATLSPDASQQSPAASGRLQVQPRLPKCLVCICCHRIMLSQDSLRQCMMHFAVCDLVPFVCLCACVCYTRLC